MFLNFFFLQKNGHLFWYQNTSNSIVGTNCELTVNKNRNAYELKHTLDSIRQFVIQ